jgi:hypothetical protein
LSRENHFVVEVRTQNPAFIRGRSEGRCLMGDRAAASLLRGAGRAGWRFVVEVAVSAVATLCVTLVLSGWFRPGTASVESPEIAPASAGSPVKASSPAVSDPLRAVDASAIAADVPVNRPLLVEKDVAEKEKPASSRALEPAPVISASSARSRSPSHLAKAAPHNAQAPCAPPCSGHSMSEASSRWANLEPPLRQAAPDPQAGVPAPASSAEEEYRPTVFGVALPTVAVHGVLTHPWRPVLQGASSVTELLTGLGGKP